MSQEMELPDDGELNQLKATALKIENEAKAVAATVKSELSANEALEWCRGIMVVMDKARAKLDPIREAQHKAWRMTCDLISEVCGPRELGVKIVKQAVKDWRAEEERKRRIEEERLAEEIRKKDLEMKQAAAKQLQKENPVLAKAILNSPIMATPPSLPKPNLPGTTGGKSFSFRVVSRMAFLKFVVKSMVKNPEWQNALLINDSWIKGQIRQADGSIKIDGLEIYEDSKLGILR